jgi:hypothetical protein
VVKDGSGAIIGNGALGAGTVTSNDHQDPIVDVNCTMSMTPITVPRVGFYQIAVGSRAPATYSYPQLVGLNWTIDLRFK